MSHIIEIAVEFGIDVVSRLGYWGIFLSQTIESIIVPIPSEVVLPFGGYLASIGELRLWLVIASATAANTLGSIIGYFIGKKGGRPLLEKWGKYLLVFPEDIEKVDALTKRRGELVSLIARILPGVRTFSSIVIGSFSVRLNKFILYTIIGSAIWNAALALTGYWIGRDWYIIRPYFHKFEIVFAIAIVIVIVFFISHQVSKLKRR